MFATFRLASPLPFASQQRAPVFSSMEVDQFVDRFEPPAALRDPFSQQLLRRPVAMQDAQGHVDDICVDEHNLRRALQESRTASDGARLVLHRPMCRQLRSFYRAAVERAGERHGHHSERARIVRSFVDAATYELQQPLLPSMTTHALLCASQAPLLCLQRATMASEQLRISIESLLPRVERADGSITSCERRRRVLLFDLQALRRHLHRARRLLWQVMTPPARMPSTFLDDWQSVYANLDSTANDHERMLLFDIPTRLADRAQSQAERSGAWLRGNATRSASP